MTRIQKHRLSKLRHRVILSQRQMNKILSPAFIIRTAMQMLNPQPERRVH